MLTTHIPKPVLTNISGDCGAENRPAVGVIVPDLVNPVHIEAAGCIERLARADGYTTLLCNAGSSAEESGCRDAMYAAGVRGLIVMCAGIESHALYAAPPVPAVLLGSRTEVPSLDYVVLDDYHAAYLVVSRLVTRGHRRIAFLSYEGAQGYSALDRMNGFRKAVKRSETPLSTEVISLPSENLADSCAAALALLDAPNRPTAVVAQNDYIAYGVLEALELRGLHAGRDVQVIGFDDLSFSMLAKLELASVAAVDGPVAKRAYRLLARRMSGEARCGRTGVVLAPRLVIRASCPDCSAPERRDGVC